jgi:RNA polymerase sigma factor (sigma-70 family)
MIESMKKSAMKPLEAARPDSDSQAFEALFREYWAYVYRGLHRLVGDPAEAEDLALETFLRLHQRRPFEREGFRAGGWLYRVAINLGLRSLRGARRRERYETRAGRDALGEAPENRPAFLQEQTEERERARQALAGMNARRSQLLILRYSGLSYKEIAAALKLSPASIGPLLARAEREFEEGYRALAREER